MQMKPLTESEKTIGEIVEKIKERFGDKLVSVLLFGSRARGNCDRRSDIDLLVVADGLPKGVQERWDLLKEERLEFLLKSGARIDTLLLSRKEVMDNINDISPLFSSFVIGNRVLYDRGFIARELKTLIKRLSASGIRYYEGGKEWNIRRMAGSGNLQ